MTELTPCVVWYGDRSASWGSQAPSGQVLSNVKELQQELQHQLIRSQAPSGQVAASIDVARSLNREIFLFH